MRHPVSTVASIALAAMTAAVLSACGGPGSSTLDGGMKPADATTSSDTGTRDAARDTTMMSRACVPGQIIPCLTPRGVPGTQACDKAGQGYNACVAFSSGDGGADAQRDSGGDGEAGATDASCTAEGGTPCLGVCFNGACVQCVPDMTRCQETAVQTCSAAYTWGAANPCPTNMGCADGGCAGSCTWGATQCVGATAQTCNSEGSWVTIVSHCPFQCYQGACVGECQDGQTECTGPLNESVCTSSATGNTWVAAPQCAGVCANGACTGVCTPGNNRCSGGDNEPGGIETCGANGEFGPVAMCPYLCSMGACTGACLPNSFECTTNNRLHTCGMTGQWDNGMSCGSDLCTVATGTCETSCVANTTQCAGLTVETCNGAGTAWEAAPTACSSACSGGACTGTCTPGMTTCNGNSLQTCDATGTPHTVTCPFSCSNNACAGQCVSGATTCMGNTLEECSTSDVWTPITPPCSYVCSDGHGDAGCTGMCTPGATQCNGSTAETCDGTGTWQPTMGCGGPCGGCSGGVCVPTLSADGASCYSGSECCSGVCNCVAYSKSECISAVCGG
jgi:hypothetical protein